MGREAHSSHANSEFSDFITLRLRHLSMTWLSAGNLASRLALPSDIAASVARVEHAQIMRRFSLVGVQPQKQYVPLHYQAGVSVAQSGGGAAATEIDRCDRTESGASLTDGRVGLERVQQY